MKNFNEIYEKVYREHGPEIEEMRKKAQKTSNTIIILWVILILFSLPISMLGFIFFILVVIAYVAMIVYTVLGLTLSKDYRNFIMKYKENIIGSFVKSYDEKLNYDPNNGIGSAIYRKAGFEGFDTFHTEDLISGIISDKYNISFAEVHTERESTDSDGNTTHYTVFHGLFGVVDLNTVLGANIKIRKNGVSLFDRKYRLEMDSQEFEKIFNIYTTDKITAMQLMTADVMQTLIDFRNKNKIAPEISIIADRLYIRFATENVFEPKLRQNSFDYSTLLKYYNIINFTLDITEKMIKNIRETAEINGIDNVMEMTEEKDRLNKIEYNNANTRRTRNALICIIIFFAYIILRIMVGL